MEILVGLLLVQEYSGAEFPTSQAKGVSELSKNANLTIWGSFLSNSSKLVYRKRSPPL